MKPQWLYSECSLFIRKILKAKTDVERTATARKWADWLEARGDREYVEWLRHPKLSWETKNGYVVWQVHP